MSPKEAAQLLRKTGMRDAAIAKAVDASVPTINRIRKGRDCLWTVGDRVVKFALARGLQVEPSAEAGEVA